MTNIPLQIQKIQLTINRRIGVNVSKIIGIDLGTTNSEVAVVVDGKPQIIPDGKQRLIPSVVGLSPDGELLVGQTAKNQYMLYPDRTVKSIKRKMGSDYSVKLGDKSYSPQEISAFILKKLKQMAENFLNEPVEKAVITVPAYFNDAQRQATKDAGEIAGLEVVRIINEPTAAALAFGINKSENQTVLVYDLGGGTFDVSIVELNDGVIEVKASHGNNYLGGDDFDKKIADFLMEDFQKLHQINLADNSKAIARIHKASEAAKIKLSVQPFTQLTEEFLAKKNSTPLHLQTELSREEFNAMIQKLVESTGDSIDKALKDSECSFRELDKVLLVGGSTRIPMIWDFVRDKTGQEPHSEINPDECVALGAAIEGAIIAGEDVDAILVDVTPYSMGIEIAEVKFGKIYTDRYSVLIHRNTVIPVSKSEVYYTMHPEQDQVDIMVYQGESKTASDNILLGEYSFKDIPATQEDKNKEIIVQFDFDIDGILHVSSTHKESGKKESISINASKQRLSDREKELAQAEMSEAIITEEDEIDLLIKQAEVLLEKVEDQNVAGELRKLILNILEARERQDSEKVEDLKEALLDKMYELD
jgi:molecular chaperone DnaK